MIKKLKVPSALLSLPLFRPSSNGGRFGAVSTSCKRHEISPKRIEPNGGTLAGLGCVFLPMNERGCLRFV